VELLQWYNLIFVAPIGLAAVYLILSASGIGGDADHDISHDMDHDVDVDHDVSVEGDADMDHDLDVATGSDLDHDVDVHTEAPSGLEHEMHIGHTDGDHDDSMLLRSLSVLGFGKVPVSVLMTCLMVIFGTTGLICNGLFESVLPWKWAPTLYFWPSLAAAVVVAISLTG
jgi:hypothetical protein